MNAQTNSRKIAIIDYDPAILEFMEVIVRDEGYEVVGCCLEPGRFDLEKLQGFLTKNDPKVVVWDLPPFLVNVQQFEEVHNVTLGQGRIFILTTTQEKQLRQIMGEEAGEYKIVEKPFHIDSFLQVIGEVVISAEQELINTSESFYPHKERE